jgi:hypothetical protein
MVISQAKAILAPAPAATPFTAAILAWIMFSETLSLSNLFAFFVFCAAFFLYFIT